MQDELNPGDEIRLNGRETTHRVESVDGAYVTVRNTASNQRKAHELKQTDGGWIDTYDRTKLNVEVVN